MELRLYIFIFYAILALVIIIFNKKVSVIIYGLLLFSTDKLNIRDLHLFKVDEKNHELLFDAIRVSLITLALLLLIFSISPLLNYLT